MDDEAGRAGYQTAVSSHVDKRSRRTKLAELANHPRTSPEEAAAARRALDALPAPKTLSRDDILAAPDLRVSVGSRRVWDPAWGVHVVIDADDPLYDDLMSSPFDWDGVE